MTANPLFFDSLFPSFQSTTPETVISDYRQRKRADSRAEHNSTVDDANANEVTKFNGNNAEFYAEVIGKLIGTIRDGVTNLIDDVKQRRMQQQQKSSSADGANTMNSEKLKNHHVNATNTLMDMTELHQTSKGAETNKMTNESESQKVSASIHDNTAMKGQREIELTTLSVHRDVAASEKKNHGNEKIQSANESSPSVGWSGVVQVIARKTKHKRSDTSQGLHRDEREHNEMNVEQLEIPIDWDPADSEMANEHESPDRSDGISDQKSNQDINGESSNDADHAKWFTKHKSLFANLSENHRQRKQKLIKLMVSLLVPSLSNKTSIVESLKSSLMTDNDDDDSSFDQVDDESNLSFTVMRGNSSIVRVTPKEFLKMFHRGTDEHANLQMRAKTTLQRAFYKYARIYLIARKGYKDARSFNRVAKEHHQEGDETSSAPSHEPLIESKDNIEKLNEVDDDGDDTFDDVFGFMTSDARRNAQALEAFAIFILEVFGAVLALTLGAIGQFQLAYFPPT